MASDTSFENMNYYIQTSLQILFTIDLMMRAVIMIDKSSDDDQWYAYQAFMCCLF